MKKVLLSFLCFLICMGASAMLTLKIKIHDLELIFNVTQKELIDNSIYLYGTNRYNIEKIKVESDTITLFTNNKEVKYGYKNPQLSKMIEESVLY